LPSGKLLKNGQSLFNIEALCFINLYLFLAKEYDSKFYPNVSIYTLREIGSEKKDQYQRAYSSEFSKKTSFENLSDQGIKRAEDILNNRPRKKIKFHQNIIYFLKV
jgi:hypothetical protein